jgi:hypothetical protein
MKTALDWVRWWSHAWREADPDWYPPALRLLTAAQMDALHAAAAQPFGAVAMLRHAPNRAPCLPIGGEHVLAVNGIR